MDNHSLIELIQDCANSKNLRVWMAMVVDWSDKSGVEVKPWYSESAGKWGARLTLSDSKGRFFNTAFPINRKLNEMDEGYRERVYAHLNKVCADMRRDRIGVMSSVRLAG